MSHPNRVDPPPPTLSPLRAVCHRGDQPPRPARPGAAATGAPRPARLRRDRRGRPVQAQGHAGAGKECGAPGVGSVGFQVCRGRLVLQLEVMKGPLPSSGPAPPQRRPSSPLSSPQALTRKFSLSADVDLAALSAACPPQLTGADLYALCAGVGCDRGRPLRALRRCGVCSRCRCVPGRCDRV